MKYLIEEASGELHKHTLFSYVIISYLSQLSQRSQLKKIWATLRILLDLSIFHK